MDVNERFFYVKNPSPCKDCESRNIGCHASCDNYKSWKSAERERSEKIRKEKDRICGFNGYKVERCFEYQKAMKQGIYKK